VILSRGRLVLVVLGYLTAGLAGTALMRAPGRDYSRLYGQEVLPAAADDSATPRLYTVRIAQAWIPMKDGVRLAVNLFLPVGAKPEEKFPALLEYLPYRQAAIGRTP
jgi:X-Pro dipeptidyl-peptidase (S15 family)